MEKLDLYDKHRRKLNRTINRGDLIPENCYVLVTTVWVVDYKNKILLTERDIKKEGKAGMWENTRGAVQSGENTVFAAVRELKEETGIVIVPSELTFIGTEVEDSINQIVDTFIIRKDINPFDIILQDGETVNYKFVSITELDEMSTKEILCKQVKKRYLYQRSDIKKFIFKIDDFFNEFKKENQLFLDIPYQVYHFTNSEYVANELCELVLANKKKATSSAKKTFEILNIPYPNVGDFSVITDYYGNPRCVIQNISVSEHRFCDMDFNLVSKEGEDENLESWQKNHEKFFKEESKSLGYTFEYEMLVVFEEFKVVFKK